MKPRLDPEEALAGPFYAVAALLVVIPLGDFLLSASAPEPSSIQWRFSTIGLLSSRTLTPILGLGLAFVLSALLKQHGMQRLLVYVCLTSGVALAGLSVLFLRDVMHLSLNVPTDERPAFSSAWHRALLKHALSAATLLYLGWSARRMIPERGRPHAPKPVHVVSK